MVFFILKLKINELFHIKHTKEITAKDYYYVDDIKCPGIFNLQKKIPFFFYQQTNDQQQTKDQFVGEKIKLHGIVQRHGEYFSKNGKSILDRYCPEKNPGKHYQNKCDTDAEIIETFTSQKG